MEKKKLDQYNVASILAVVISLVALLIGIIETNIMKEQMIIMDEQQKASVWPYIQPKIGFEYADKVKMTGKFMNKGVGPAIIKSEAIIFGDESFSDFTALKKYLDKVIPDHNYRLNTNINTSSVRVVSPGEEIEMISIEFDRYPGDVNIARSLAFQISLCYCSIYDDCWDQKGDIAEGNCMGR
jgi:hypothetical protein